MLLPPRNRIAKSLLRFANRHRDGDCKTTLPGTAKGAVANDLRGHLHIGVRQNDDVILRSALALRAFSVVLRHAHIRTSQPE